MVQVHILAKAEPVGQFRQAVLLVRFAFKPKVLQKEIDLISCP